MIFEQLSAPCYICKDKKRPPGIFGYYYANQETLEGVIECECLKKWKLLYKTHLLSLYSGISRDPEFNPYAMDNQWLESPSVQKVIRYATNMSLNDENSFKSIILYLQGTPSSYKTSLLSWISKVLVEKGITVRYTSYLKFLSDICPDSFDFETIAKAKVRYEEYLDVDILMIDRCFEQKTSSLKEWQLVYLETFLEDRLLVNKKGIIMASRHLPIVNTGYQNMSSVLDLIRSELVKKNTLVELPDCISNFEVKDIWS